MSRWERFRRLGGEERKVLLRATVALPVISLALHAFGFRRLQEILTRLSPKPSALPSVSESVFARARLTTRMVDAASREGCIRARCLERSLAAWWLLRWQRIPAQLRIGVRKEGLDLHAHAWLESSGVVLNDSGEIFQGYTAFARAIESIGHSSP